MRQPATKDQDQWKYYLSPYIIKLNINNDKYKFGKHIFKKLNGKEKALQIVIFKINESYHSKEKFKFSEKTNLGLAKLTKRWKITSKKFYDRKDPQIN